MRMLPERVKQIMQCTNHCWDDKSKTNWEVVTYLDCVTESLQSIEEKAKTQENPKQSNNSDGTDCYKARLENLNYIYFYE